MNSFLSSIGFSNVRRERDMEKILDLVTRKYTERQAVRKEKETAFVEYSKEFGPGIGITVCGELDEEGFHREYYYPYFRGTGISTQEDLVVEKHGGKNSYAGVVEDMRVGISLIFFVQNNCQYLKAVKNLNLLNQPISTTFSGLANKGMILLPVCKSEEQRQYDQEASQKRSSLISAARNGDEEAIESLTLEDMDTYTMISQRIHEEDIFSIVDTFLMPHGLECDQYQVMGEIKSIDIKYNEWSKEKLYQMKLSCNDIEFDVCINAKNLLGEPEIGRRFKGNIWLQGNINFPEEKAC